MNQELTRFYQFLVKTGKLRNAAECVSVLQRQAAQISGISDVIKALQQAQQLPASLDLHALHAEYQRFLSPSGQMATRTEVMTKGSAAQTAASGAQAGQMIGPHRVIKELGKGACGVVYLAEDTQLKRKVVIKQLLPGANADDMMRFMREAVAMGKINSPHVAGIHQLENQPGRPSLVIDFVDGTDMKALLDRGLPTRERALKLFMGLVRGVAAIHAAGLVHRDLKPANVMVREPDHAVVVDFGMVKMVGTVDMRASQVDLNQVDVELTEAGSLLGTPMYMAPEQALGEDASTPADVYALGKILYELLTGERVHPQQASMTSLLMDIAGTDVTARVADKLSAMGIPSGLAKTCLTMLKLNAGERYPDAQRLLTDLENFFKDEEQEAVRIEEQRKAKAKRRELELANQKLVIDGQRKRMNLLMVIGALVGIALVGVSFTFAWGRKQAQAAQAAAEATAKAQAEAAESAQQAAQEAERRAAFERSQREATQAVADAHAMIGQGQWQQASDKLKPVVEACPDHAEARRLLAESLDILEDAGRLEQYLWLAEHTEEGIARQDYLLRAVMAIDSLPDGTPDQIQAQLSAANPVIARMNGLHRQAGEIMRDLYAANLLMNSGQAVRGQSDFTAALRRSENLLEAEHSSWTTAFMAGLYRALLQDWQGAFRMMDRAAVINPNYHMTLYWRQRIRRSLAEAYKPSLRAYGELSAALVDLARLRQMKPFSPVPALDFADCLLEISFPSIDADAELRQPRIRQAIDLLDECEQVLDEERYRPLSERVYLVRAKAHALRYTLSRRDSDRRDAERYLERARQHRTAGMHDPVYQTVLELLQRN